MHSRFLEDVRPPLRGRTIPPPHRDLPYDHGDGIRAANADGAAATAINVDLQNQYTTKVFNQGKYLPYIGGHFGVFKSHRDIGMDGIHQYDVTDFSDYELVPIVPKVSPSPISVFLPL